MNILHISAASQNSGAGYAVMLTHQTLIEYGINSKVLYLVGENYSNQNIYFYTSNSIIRKLRRVIITTLDRVPTWIYLSRKEQLFSPGLVGLNLRHSKLLKWADIIHIHWANHGFIDIKEIGKWNKPVVWTIRDMWPFTGGCHYSFDCDKYKFNCGGCPVLCSDRKHDLSHLALRRKIKYLSTLSIHWVAISRWMKARAISSSVLKQKSISLIFSGIDCNTFKIVDNVKARDFFNFPYDTKIIIIGAVNLREECKGFQYVINTLNKIDKEYLVVTFGDGNIIQDEIPQKVINLGYINNGSDLANLYNSADIFLAPSKAEAFGKTFAEAQACGLPVVCFDETGPADIIEHLKTGYLASFKDEGDLLNGLLFCLTTTFNRNYISDRAKELFDIRTIAKQYIYVYGKTLSTGVVIHSK